MSEWYTYEAREEVVVVLDDRKQEVCLVHPLGEGDTPKALAERAELITTALNEQYRKKVRAIRLKNLVSLEQNAFFDALFGRAVKEGYTKEEVFPVLEHYGIDLGAAEDWWDAN